ncbi:MAG: hypothetical protein PVJ80_11335 [Gemmatimonadota bacterium]|jgi:hypothetical protein
MIRKKRLVAASFSALAAAALAACGNLTAGGLTGEATVVVSGDADTLSAAALAAPAGVHAGAPNRVAPSGPALAEHEEVEGQLEVEFLVYLVDEAGEAIQLGDEIEAQVDLKGRTEMDVVDRQSIPATLYTELRLIFTDIHAEVEGLVIDGTPIPEVHVELEHLSLLVSRPIDLDVQEGDQVELVVDLNSLAWLDAVDPESGAVNESVFQDLVNVVIR